MTTLTYNQAMAIFTVLVKEAGAHESGREDFVFHAISGTTEYRFQGALGFGGKFRPETWRVDCYPEDNTPERERMIKATNAALGLLRVTH